MNAPVEPNIFDRLTADVSQCMLRQRRALLNRVSRLRQADRDGRLSDAEIGRVVADVEQSAARRLQRYHGRPRPQFPAELPVVAARDEIAAAIGANQVVIVCGETGSGKTTQLPKICLELGRGVEGLIGHTQPRRLAARSVAARIADELHTNLGDVVGYKVRFNDRTGQQTYVKLMTDGILLAEVQTDRLLEQYDTIIIDEAHERSLNIDFLLGYLRQLLPRRPDLKVIVTSATIDPERFSKHFDSAPIITVSGRSFPVEVRYRPLQSDDPEEEDRGQAQAIVEAVAELSRDGPGDVLVFLSGEREIRETAEELRKHHPPQTDVLPLYARLSAAEQQRIFQPHGRRRIVLATNVAETSLTVPGIRYVVDTGVARISRYSARTKVQRLPIEPISQASADQRKGRCGRVAEGICIRLYAEQDYLDRPAFTEPEILRTNLASVILQMTYASLGKIETFPFVERPDPRLVRDGYLTLHELGAVTEENALTPLGRHLGRLPIDPRLGRMVIAADREACLTEVLVIAAALSVQDPRERPVELQAVADQAHEQFRDEGSDFLGYLKLWDFFREKQKNLSNSQLRKACKQQFLSYLRLREWQDVHEQLNALVTEMGWKPNDKPAPPEWIHRSLLTGLLANVGNKTETAEYAGVRGGKFFLFPGSVLFAKRPPWVMAAEVVETNRLYARTNAKVLPEWIERAAEHLVKRSHTDPHWDAQRADVIAGEQVTLRGLVIVPHRNVSYGPIDPRTAREVFIHHALVEGDFRSGGESFKHNQQLVRHVKSLEAKARRHDLLADARQPFAFFNARVPADVYNGVLFERWRKRVEPGEPRLLFMSLADVSRAGIAEVSDAGFPDEIRLGSLTVGLTYLYDTARADDGVTATVPLALLNQTPAGAFEWLVPGLLHEKVVELIRTLPKAIRTRLVPAPDAAAAAIVGLRDADRTAPFLPALAHQLGKRIGEQVPPQLLDATAIPAFLRMNFRVTDAAGKVVASGRDLVALRAQLGVRARESFAALPPREFNRDGLKSWDFGDLPERVEVRRDHATFSGFPAIVDQGQAVGLRLLDSREASVVANRAGVRRLFMLQLDHELKLLTRGLEHVEQMALLYKPLGSWAQLREQLMSAAVDRALFNSTDVDIRTRDAFVLKAEDGWRQLTVAVRELNRLCLGVLTVYGQVQVMLDRTFPPLLLEPVNDMRDQLRQLVPADFLTATPPTWFLHVNRYVRGIYVRLTKLLNAGLPRDRELLANIKPLLRVYIEQRESAMRQGRVEPRLVTARWMLEELRVSLFAQELKTSMAISVQRVEKQLSAVTN